MATGAGDLGQDEQLAPPMDHPNTIAHRVNAKFGRDTLFSPAVGIEHGWKQQVAHHSPRYTTRLDELPRVQA